MGSRIIDLYPPATAGTIETVTPAAVGVFSPSRKRTVIVVYINIHEAS
jgi:hypothetical protein